uniref:Uncharacterized protein n=1 Tax=Myotis myotis TaxID=51298 RepID=A0A7J7QWP2_MYOMY|nr:hypothetical protein mMyoMyo1_011280 [Myotis myotis]
MPSVFAVGGAGRAAGAWDGTARCLQGGPTGAGQSAESRAAGVFFKKNKFLLISEGEGERNINAERSMDRLPPARPALGIEPAARAGALTGNRTLTSWGLSWEMSLKRPPVGPGEMLPRVLPAAWSRLRSDRTDPAQRTWPVAPDARWAGDAGRTRCDLSSPGPSEAQRAPWPGLGWTPPALAWPGMDAPALAWPGMGAWKLLTVPPGARGRLPHFHPPLQPPPVTSPAFGKHEEKKCLCFPSDIRSISTRPSHARAPAWGPGVSRVRFAVSLSPTLHPPGRRALPLPRVPSVSLWTRWCRGTWALGSCGCAGRAGASSWFSTRNRTLQNSRDPQTALRLLRVGVRGEPPTPQRISGARRAPHGAAAAPTPQ